MSVPHGAPVAAPAPDSTTVKFAGHLFSVLSACHSLGNGLQIDGSEASIGAALRLELSAITHLLQARACASELTRTNPMLAECSSLFLAGTQALEYSTIVMANDYMLGRRLPVSTARRFSLLMLEAIERVYPPQRAQQPVPPPRPAPPRARAAAA